MEVFVGLTVRALFFSNNSRSTTFSSQRGFFDGFPPWLEWPSPGDEDPAQPMETCSATAAATGLVHRELSFVVGYS
jgi:hypothetical protein